jgi:glycosyltransferase involved in cell wall biosynthesis
MTIGFDGSRAFTSSKTGTENYSYQLLKHLSQIDTQNYYVVYLRPGINISESWPKNFRFVTIPLPRLWTQLGLAYRTFIDPIDLLFTPSHTLPLVRRPGLKTLITVHDLGAEYLPQTHQLKQKLYLNLMTHYQLKTATKILAVSEATKKDLVHKVGIKSGKITVTYEGFDSKLFKPVPRDIVNNYLKQFDIQSGNYYLFIGTIQPRKNLKNLIIAYQQAILTPKNFSKQNNNLPKLVLIGGKGWLADDIYTLPKSLGIEKYVKFLGYIEAEKLPYFYSGAKSFLFPSLFEGFGLPILESFACNCPVLTSNSSSMPEVAGDGAILVDPKSVESISNGIVTISNDNIREDLIKKGKLQLQKFSWEKCAQETLEVINSF